MLVELDAALRRRTRIGWIVFRAIAAVLVAVGLFAWCGLWFMRDIFLGVAMSVMCVLVLANELGLLRPRGLG